STITVTLKDALNRGTPGKLVTLSQAGGHSLVSGPTPSVTDANGKIQFAAKNFVGETVTYTATDVSDGDLAVPGAAMVTVTGGSGPSCGGLLSPVMGAQFAVSDFITGFPGASQNCVNPAGVAFDNAGNVYVSDYAGFSAEGGVYKFPATGGV